MNRHDLAPGAAAATFALCLLAATPALADPGGYVAVSGGWDNIAFGDSSSTINGSALQVLASGAYMFTPVLGAQGDVRLDWRSFDNLGGIDDAGIDGALHGFYREDDKFLLGGFVQFGGSRVSSDHYNQDLARFYAGAEGQLYLDSLTLYGQVGLQRTDFSDVGYSASASGWFGSLEARYFLTPDFRIDGHVGLSTYDGDGVISPSATVSTLNLGIGTEYRFETLPVSLFASYDFRSSTSEMYGSSSLEEQRLLVGARFAIGEDSLLDRDRNGASLSAVQPNVSRLIYGP